MRNRSMKLFMAFSLVLASLGFSQRTLAKPLIKLNCPVKVSTYAAVAPSSRAIFGEFVHNYFDDNFWGLTDVHVNQSTKKKKDIFEIESAEPFGSKNKYHAFTLKIKGKKNRLKLTLVMTKSYVKYKRELLANPDIGNKELRTILKAELIEHLDDLKSYW
ncbi:MAG: hypothetical protein ACI9QD_000288 [Thermoproteota archaeon]|jgi:hypothetical protein